ncbi:LamG domain-containing protein [bacterium]|nr:LamG domain-containing protein [bacterium]
MKTKTYSSSIIFLLLAASFVAFFGTPAFADGAGNCLDFDGVDDYVDCGSGSSLDFTGSVTVEAWIKPGPHSNYERIFATHNNFDSPYCLTRGDNTNSIAFAWRGYERQTPANAITPGVWNHVVAIFDTTNNAITIYINGVEQSLESITDFGFSGTTVWIGGKQNNSRFFNGRIDEVRVWKELRSETEIRQNMYRELSGSESNLKGYWRFNETSGTTLDDATSYNNDGTLHNMSSNDWVTSGAFAGPRNALDFDGSNDYVDVGNGISPTSQITLEAWIYKSATSSKPCIYGFGDDVQSF